MKIFATGLNSYLGSSFVIAAEQSGYLVHPLVNKSGDNLRLGDEPSLSDIDSNSFIFHFAWSRNGGKNHQRDTNLTGLQKILEPLSDTNAHFVFISSMAVESRPFSHYGQLKFDAEQLVSNVGGTSVRVGLVWDDEYGGQLAKLAKTARAIRLVPNLAGIEPRLNMVHREDVARELLQFTHSQSADRQYAKYHVFANPEQVSLRRVFELVTGSKHQSSIRIPRSLVCFLDFVATRFRFIFSFWDGIHSLLLAKAQQLDVALAERFRSIPDVQ